MLKAYERWLRATARPRTAPTSAQARSGERVFMGNACASCHQIRGTRARGHVGPDLTHLMTTGGDARIVLDAVTVVVCSFGAVPYRERNTPPPAPLAALPASDDTIWASTFRGYV